MAKYRASPRVHLPDRKWPDRRIERAPAWCSVDLRDGNQALATPMSVAEKLEMFELLVEVGFKEIEVGFPSASQIEYDFIRRLIEEDRIPEDVTVQILTQAREHLIRRSFESLRGARSAIVHLYNSTSPLQRRVTFGMSKEQVKEIAIRGTELVRELVATVPETQVRFEYSPESFSDTETDYALEVCEAVLSAWQPREGEKVIFNLPATVECSTPNVYADQIEWFCRNLKERERVSISLHTHNDPEANDYAYNVSYPVGNAGFKKNEASKVYQLPTLVYTKEEQEILKDWNANAAPLIAQYRDGIATASMPLSAWDELITKIKGLGYDKYARVVQAAYGRYAALAGK